MTVLPDFVVTGSSYLYFISRPLTLELYLFVSIFNGTSETLALLIRLTFYPPPITVPPSTLDPSSVSIVFHGSQVPKGSHRGSTMYFNLLC